MFDLVTTRPTAAAPFADLNSAQLQAVDHDGGPLLVLAGAGTGKTMTLAARVARLVDEGVDPSRILLLTFTRRAAAEMRTRADTMLARAPTPHATTGTVVAGTFHSVANRLLRRHADRIGLDRDFSLLDAADAADLIDLVREDLEVAVGTTRFPRKATLAAVYTRVVNSRVRLDATLDAHFPWCREHVLAIGRVFTEYSVRKRAQNLLDYDDLLLFWKVMAEAEGIGEELGGAFDHVLVDEYQDTNALQAEIVQALRRDNDNLTVVGDDAQAVYGFRAADVRNILDFPLAFPSTTIVRLEHNYRSTQAILDTANAVLAEMPQAREQPEFAKSLFSHRMDGARPRLHTCHDEADQSHRICQAVLDRREQGTALTQQAVLFRSGHHSAHLELELARHGIPYVKFGGLKYLEAAHVKDLLALLRILDNPGDQLAWFRILQRLEGIGPGRAKRLLGAITGVITGPGSAQGPHTRLEGGSAGLGVDLPATAARAVDGLADAILQALAIPLVGGQIQRLREWYTPVCAQAFDDHLPRLADLEQLEVVAADTTDRTRFLDDLVLDPPASTGDLAGPPLLDEDYLILSTIHSAKGLEWDTVHLLHAADGMIPSDMSTGKPEELEEERRLLYVALTRARHELDVYVPLRYHHQRFGSGDRHSYGQVSRFLQGPVRETMQRIGPSAVPDEAIGVLVGGAAAKVDVLLQDLW